MPGSPVDAALAKLASSGQPDHQRAAAGRRDPARRYRTRTSSRSTGDYLEEHRPVQLRHARTRSRPRRSRTTIGKALPWTIVLVGVTTVIAFIIGTLLGVFAGWRRGTAADTSVTLGATFFAAFPPFWLGLLLLYFLAFKYGWFPIKGGYDEGADTEPQPGVSRVTRSGTACCRR